MEGLNMTEIQRPNGKFDYDTFARYCKINPSEAEKYRKSFEIVKVEEKSVETIKSDVSETLKSIEADITKVREIEQSSSESEVNSEQQSNENNNELPQNIVINDQDVEVLRQVYLEKAGKKANTNWKGTTLVSKINDLSK